MKNDDQVFTKQLIDQLIDKNGNGTKGVAERFLLDTALWYIDNLNTVKHTDIEKRIEFQEKATEMMINLFAFVLERVKKVESESKGNNILLPGIHF